MFRVTILAAFAIAIACLPASAQDKAKDWCTNAHMQKMQSTIGKMTDAAKKKEAKSHLAMSKAAMKAKDMDGCVKHMEQAHQAMGL
ncbi:hypothetical protein HYPDE_35443 [Hyphomicrobium denitrificans 1NES1]|uniref:Uncharacterized protein n=1 Tax=Hyphomicrobium denitrificans 1NES1 TaxID=670307 RepID=N0BF59_9HYPH|nr:hypothetical protein [Hyphomicrobium denitrificans]AGK58760.1 hypothetical protein HYPDE_35443 [Hyphomicrobium denitrificans 1NES1]